MIGPTKEQLQNAAWWDENAPEGAVCMIDGEFTRWDGTDELIWRGGDWSKSTWPYSLDEYESNNRDQPGYWSIVYRPVPATGPDAGRLSQHQAKGKT